MLLKVLSGLLLLYVTIALPVDLDLEVPIIGTALFDGEKLTEFIDERVEEDVKEILGNRTVDVDHQEKDEDNVDQENDDDEDEEMGSGQDCRSGWQRFGSSCYLFSSSGTSWYGAKRVCESKGAHLAETETKSEIEFLKTEATKIDQTFWLGGSDRKIEGEWVWESNGQGFTVTNWHPASEPNNENGNEDCLDLHGELNYQWNDENCSLYNRYICKESKVFSRCTNGWLEFGNNCYLFSDSEENWTGAQASCQRYGARLAEVYSNTEIRFLQDQARTEGHKFWLGGTDKKIEGNWIWASTGNQFTVTDWADESEPNNAGGNEDCVSIKDSFDFEWNDEGCSNRHRYICEIQVEDEEPVH